ncbi:MAG: hypothetical protein EZS28_019436 [Streblomastix strix]|uniref:SPRY domain-containing protein n=1 Tax=Streblomastix strix TaxID=222440 RepID=A0A5J4VQU2_9EUKA|nr:MAG: hypothetical protein EZS28_019436 [Streblomastix strix]
MAVPNEYNIIGGLLGLGPDILLAILTEMILVPDAVQLVGVNYPISIHNPDPFDIVFTDIDEVQKKISKHINKYNTVSLTQVLESGIWQMEAVFQNTRNRSCIGIVEDSYIIPAGALPWISPHQEHMITYNGAGQPFSISAKGKSFGGNAYFYDFRIIRLEMDCDKGTLTFFFNDVQQPLYISGINEKVRFIIFIYWPESSCIIRSLKKLATPTSQRLANEKAIQW